MPRGKIGRHSVIYQSRDELVRLEGQVNRLKTLKRQMYGRAGVELLRARMIALAPESIALQRD
jgi:hypothetical protein